MRSVWRILTAMSKAQNDAQTVSFFWAPYSYKVRWVETPEDVPVWDVSRGFPLTVGMDSGSVDKVSSQLELLRKLLKLGHVAYKDTAATWEPSLGSVDILISSTVTKCGGLRRPKMSLFGMYRGASL